MLTHLYIVSCFLPRFYALFKYRLETAMSTTECAVARLCELGEMGRWAYYNSGLKVIGSAGAQDKVRSVRILLSQL